MNYFLGIDADDGTLVADFEDTADRRSITRSRAPPWYQQRLAPRGRHLRRHAPGASTSTARLDAHAGGRQLHAALRQHPARRHRHGDDLDRCASGFFQGVIDEARIWNVARSASPDPGNRFQELTSGSGLVARYGLNEGSGSTVGNSSIAGAPNGTAVGAPRGSPGFPLPDQAPPAAPTGLSATPATPRRPVLERQLRV